MIQLYVKFDCPFCGKVMQTIEKLNLKKGEDFEYIDAALGTPGREIVFKEGGKSQVPFMIDGDTRMYESGDIIEYIEKKFSK